MRKKKTRIEISPELAAEVQFLSDRTCCVCRIRGKPYQIHHIDENPANNAFDNLAVLCFDCHNDTQIRGGFGRKLDAEQVVLYRNDWLVLVAKRRASKSDRSVSSMRTSEVSLEIATSLAEIYRERQEYELLAAHYDSIGNEDLRDKYIELAIKHGVSAQVLIYLRGMQGKIDLVPSKILLRQIKQMEDAEDWSQLGRLYRTMGDHQSAVKVTCKSIIRSIEDGRPFAAAFYLKELVKEGSLDALFKIALEEARKDNDLWWQYRALEELGWDTEVTQFLIDHRTEIEASGNPLLIMHLAAILNDMQRYIELRKQIAYSTHRAKLLVIHIQMRPEANKRRTGKLVIHRLMKRKDSKLHRVRRVAVKKLIDPTL